MEILLCFKRFSCVSGLDIFRITHSSETDSSAMSITKTYSANRKRRFLGFFQNGYCRLEIFSITIEYIFPDLNTTMHHILENADFASVKKNNCSISIKRRHLNCCHVTHVTLFPPKKDYNFCIPKNVSFV